MPRPRLKPETLRRITRMLLQGQPGEEIARVVGVCPSTVSNVRKTLPVAVKPRPSLPAPEQVRQTGERWSEEYQFMIKLISPAWASGDLEMNDDHSDQEI